MRVVEIVDRPVVVRALLVVLATVLGLSLSFLQSPPVLADPGEPTPVESPAPGPDPSDGSGADGSGAGGSGGGSGVDDSVRDPEWVAPTGKGLVRPDWVSAGVTARAKNERVEVLSQRTETSRTWISPDGSAETEQAMAGVRFKDPEAKDSADGWVDIDPSLVVGADGSVSAKAVPGEVSLAGPGKDAVVSLTSPAGGSIEVGSGLAADLPKPTVDGAVATYPNVLDGVDLQVQVRPHGAEVHWVLKNPAGVTAFLGEKGVGPLNDELSVPVEVGTGVKAKLDGQGSVQFVDSKGRPAGSVSGSASMWDAATDATTGEPAEVEPIDVSATTASGLDLTKTAVASDIDLGLSLNQEWLSDPARQFPITVDPTYASGSAGSGFDAFVQQGYTTDESGDEHLKVGNNGSGQIARSYLTFDANKVTGKKIMSAQLKLYEWHSWSCSSRDWAIYDSGVASSSSRWTAQPSIGSKRATSSQTKGFSSSCPNGWVSIDMKNQVQDFADSSGGNKGVMIRAVDETDAYGWKQFDSREGTNPPVFSWTYNRVPATMAAITVPGAVSYQAAGDSAPVLYTADTTPTVSGVVSDPDGNTSSGKFYIDAPKYTGVTSCASGQVASGSRASCTWPAIADGTDGWIRSRAIDSNNAAGGWGPFTELRIAAATPAAPAISCTAPYSNNTWQTTVPATDVSCAVSATGSGYAAPSKIRWSVDNGTFTDTAITQSTSASTAKTTVKLPKATGGHSVRAYALSPTGKISSLATYSVGWGTPSLIAPKTSPVVTTTDRVAVEASGPPKGTSAAPTGKVQWRVAGAANSTDGWKDAAGTTVALSEASGATKATTVFDTTTIVGQADASNITVPARVASRVEVRVCLAYSSGTQCTSASPVNRVPHAFGSGFPEADAGPGKIGLWTGELSVAESDADLATPDGSLSVSRAHTSFAGPAAPQNAVFGPGWTASFDGDGEGMSGSELIDSTHIDGSLVLADPEGEQLVFVTQNGARRTSAALATGDYMPADEATEAAGIRLTVSGSGASTTVKLTGEDGTITTFKVAAAPTANAGVVFRATGVSDTAVAGTTTYSYDSSGRVTAIVAGLPDGVTSCVPGTPTKGCRVLKISYATATTATATAPGDYAGRVKAITAQVNTDADRHLAAYSYDSAGLLVKVTDTRTALATGYGYTGTGTDLRLATMTPPGLAPFTFSYTSNKLAKVTRPNPASAGGGTAQLGAYVYDVLVAGTVTDMVDLGAEAAKWQLASAPTKGFAVFGQDAPIGGVPAAGDQIWKSADLQFTDPLGYTVVTGSYGAGDWQFTAAEYDDNDNVTRAWDERATAALRAGEITDPEAASTRTVYNTDIKNSAGDIVTPAGTLVTDTYSPARPVASGGEVKVLRTHTHTDYDQNAPNAGMNTATGQPYRLPTRTVLTSEDLAGTVEETLSTTFTGYQPLESGDKSGWDLGQATSSTVDMDGDKAISVGDITSRTRSDARGRIIERHQPKSDGTDAGTRQTVYYTAGASSVAACGSKPEYAGMPCRAGLTAQPAGTTLPVTWSRSYTWDLQEAVSAEVSGSAESVTTTSYDAKDRPTTVSIASTGFTGSTPVPDVTTSYDDATGLTTGTSSTTGSATTSYDTWGRAISLRTTAPGGIDDTSTTTYDTAGRIAKVVDNNGETAYTYDGTDATNNAERRGLVTGVAVKLTGGTAYTSTAGYGSDGSLTVERLPGQIVRHITTDLTGELTGLSYNGWATNPDTGQAAADQPWLGWTSVSNAEGQVTREWMPDGGNQDLGTAAISSDRSYSYDQAGRLMRVNDTTGNPTTEQSTVPCQVRTYSFDANGNRTNQAVYQPAADGTCQSSTGGTSTTHSYDTADRPTTGGDGTGTYNYDALGRQTSIPAVDTPNPAKGDVSLGYYDTDAIKTISQSGTITSFDLDGSGRRLTQTVSTGGTQQSQITRHYTDSSDNPTWSLQTDSTGTTTTRYTELASGDLGLTLTTRPDGTITGDLALAAPRGDTAAIIGIPNGSQTATGAALTGVDNWDDYMEYGTPNQAVNTNVGGATGIGYGWLGAKQRSTIGTGFILMGARLYNPATGLFTSLDPEDNGGDTAYGYPNDPVNSTDLDGNRWNWREAVRTVGRVLWKYKWDIALTAATFIPGVGGVVAGARAAMWAYRAYRVYRGVRSAKRSYRAALFVTRNARRHRAVARTMSPGTFGSSARSFTYHYAKHGARYGSPKRYYAAMRYHQRRNTGSTVRNYRYRGFRNSRGIWSGSKWHSFF